MRRRTVIASLLVCLSGMAHGQLAPSWLSADLAARELASGTLVLVDIRTPAEWADTGVPQGAIRLDAESAGFEVRLAGLRLDNPGKRIALIDRAGGLAASVRQTLSQRGWRDLAVVRGGMLGETGWLTEKLPVVSFP